MVSKQERSLTWKYFLQQKFTEIGLFILIALATIFVPYLLGHYIGDNMNFGCGDSNIYESECNVFIQWIEGLLYLFFGGFVSLVVVALIWGWLESNWEKAKKRAKAEVHNIKKGRKRR